MTHPRTMDEQPSYTRRHTGKTHVAFAMSILVATLSQPLQKIDN
jgi:hypothetical protein